MEYHIPVFSNTKFRVDLYLTAEFNKYYLCVLPPVGAYVDTNPDLPNQHFF